VTGVITAAGSAVTTAIITTTATTVTTTERLGWLQVSTPEPAPAYPAIRSRIAGVGSRGVEAMR
jgi:hypothetical protein